MNPLLPSSLDSKSANQVKISLEDSYVHLTQIRFKKAWTHFSLRYDTSLDSKSANRVKISVKGYVYLTRIRIRKSWIHFSLGHDSSLDRKSGNQVKIFMQNQFLLFYN